MKRILVVCSDQDASLCMLNKLRRYNLDYYAVTSGRACLEIVENHDFCIAVIDNSVIDIQGLGKIKKSLA